ncbi:MAG: cell division protein FtsL [Acidobacteriota bacterium]
MAACTTTYFESGRSLVSRAADRNAELIAEQPLRRRRVRTPEFYFAKRFDNTRLVKAPDPVRAQQMRVFGAAVTVLFSLIMVYGLQHFYAIESSYRVESEKVVLEQLQEQNRQLRLKEAELDQPERIDRMARQLGLAAPQPGQVVHPAAQPDANGPVLAQVTPPAKSSF